MWTKVYPLLTASLLEYTIVNILILYYKTLSSLIWSQLVCDVLISLESADLLSSMECTNARLSNYCFALDYTQL